MYTFQRAVTRYLLAFLIFSLLLLGFSAQQVHAKVGVGIGTGKIIVDEPLKAGMINSLPSISVVNTGDVTSDYKLSVQYHQDQPEKQPLESWFVFSPNNFTLEPNEVQVVDISLHLPLQVEPGEYFAYLEAAPVILAQDGNSQVGIAAAAKLYFTIDAANVFMALYYKTISFWNFYQPWTSRITLIITVLIGVVIFRRYVKIELRPRNNNTQDSIPEDE